MSNRLPPPQDWALADAQTAVARPLAEAVGVGGLTRRRAYLVAGDHWQQGREWIGPRGSPETQALVLAAVEPQHTPNDVVSEGLDNAEDGLFTVEAALEIVPLDPAPEGSPEAEAQAEEAEALRREVSEWWDEIGLWEIMAAAYRHSLWSTRGPVRIRIPSGLLADGVRLPRAADRREALANIRVEAPPPDVARVYEDPDTLDRAAIFLYREDDQDRAELWVESGGRVTVRTLSSGGEQSEAVLMPEGVRLPITEITSPLLITDAVLRQQQRLNFYETLAVRVGETAGFPERYFTNTDPPGLWQTARPVSGDYLDTRPGEFGTEYKVPVPLALGAGVANFLVGIPYGSREDPKLSQPGVTFRDPTNPEYVIRLCQHGRRTLLQAMKQAHMAGDSVAEASGVAYQQARSRFETWLRRRKAGVEGALRYIVTGALALTEAMGAPRVTDRFRVRIDLTVNAGPVLPEQQRTTAELYSAGLRARATALAETGIEDAAAEEDAIRSGPAARLGEMRGAADAVEVLDRTEYATPEVVGQVLRDAGWPIVDLEEYLRALQERAQPRPGEPGSGMGTFGVRIPGLTDE